tara:strand:- start:618 stop:1073 length:456 start_codon:yes stop_codon:yes gene_type:complete
MISLLDMINPDISYLIGIQVSYNNNKNKLIQQLNDKIMFIKHMNYYKRFKSFNNNYLKYMIMNEKDYIKLFNSLKDEYGWIYDKKMNGDIWKLSDDPKYNNITKRVINSIDLLNYSHNYMKDKTDDETLHLMFYPPSKRFYNYKDFIKYIK